MVVSGEALTTIGTDSFKPTMEEKEEDGNTTRVCKGEKKKKITGKMRP